MADLSVDPDHRERNGEGNLKNTSDRDRDATMGIVNGLLGIRIVTPENRSDVQRGHILTRESISVPRDLRHRNDGRRVIPFDARSLSGPGNPLERKREKDLGCS